MVQHKIRASGKLRAAYEAHVTDRYEEIEMVRDGDGWRHADGRPIAKRMVELTIPPMRMRI